MVHKKKNKKLNILGIELTYDQYVKVNAIAVQDPAGWNALSSEKKKVIVKAVKELG